MGPWLVLCVSREWQTAGSGAESLHPPLPEHSLPRAAKAPELGPYVEQRANMERVTLKCLKPESPRLSWKLCAALSG